jgi:hypothetical protein
MSNQITFIKKPVITSISPQSGFSGTSFTIYGQNLEDVKSVFFVDPFEREISASFNVGYQGSSAVLFGKVPSVDGTTGQHMVRVRNEVGQDSFCCFVPYTPTFTSIPNISGDVTKQNDDRYAINSEISDTPSRIQGFEVISLSYIPQAGNHKLLIQAEVSVQSSFWGSAVVALFKNNEWTPRKVWNYSLLGINMGQVAKIGFVAQAEGLGSQTWRVRVGRAANTYPIIYINRNIQTSIPYGGAASTWMSITEIEG